MGPDGIFTRLHAHRLSRYLGRISQRTHKGAVRRRAGNHEAKPFVSEFTKSGNEHLRFRCVHQRKVVYK